MTPSRRASKKPTIYTPVNKRYTPFRVPEREYNPTAADELVQRVRFRNKKESNYDASRTQPNRALFSTKDAAIYSIVSRTGELGQQGVNRHKARATTIQQEAVYDMAAFRRMADPYGSQPQFTPSVYDIAAIGALRYGITSRAFHDYALALQAIARKAGNQNPFLQKPINLISALNHTIRGKPFIEEAYREISRINGIITVEKINEILSTKSRYAAQLTPAVFRLLEAMGKLESYPQCSIERKGKNNSFGNRKLVTIWIQKGKKLPENTFFPVLELLGLLGAEPRLLSTMHFPFRSRGKYWGTTGAKLSYKSAQTTLELLTRAGIVQKTRIQTGKEGRKPTAFQLTTKGQRYANEYKQTHEYPLELRVEITRALKHNSRKVEDY